MTRVLALVLCAACIVGCGGDLVEPLPESTETPAATATPRPPAPVPDVARIERSVETQQRSILNMEPSADVQFVRTTCTRGRRFTCFTRASLRYPGGVCGRVVTEQTGRIDPDGRARWETELDSGRPHDPGDAELVAC